MDASEEGRLAVRISNSNVEVTNQMNISGMTLLSEAANTESEQIIDIIGSAEKYALLMDLVRSFKECDEKIEAFKELWETVDQAHSAIEDLQRCPAFFAIFLRTKTSKGSSYGDNILYTNYAMTSFSNGKQAVDIRRIL